MRTRWRSVLALGLAGVVAAAGFAAFSVARGIERVRADETAAVDAAWATVARAVGALPATRRTPDRIREIVRLFDGDDFVTVTLVTPAGALRDRSSPPRRTAPAPAWFARLIVPSDAGRRFDLPGIGALRIDADPARPVDRLYADTLAGAAALLALAGLCALLADRTFRRLTGPLDRLRLRLEQAGGGDFSVRAGIAAPDDVAVVGAAFDRMVGRLAEVRARDARIAAQMAEAEDEERRALARDLHDEIGPLLLAIDVDAAAIRDLAAGPPDPGRDAAILERARTAGAAVAAVKRQVRALLGQLRPGSTQTIGLAQTIHDQVAFFALHHPRVDFAVAVPEEGFGESVDVALAAIVREAVANALKHGHPTRIEIEVALRDERIRLKVADDGGGLKRPAGEGWGIVGMGERAAALGGRLSVDNRFDVPGVVVSAVIPPPGRTGAAVDGEEAR
ncbi:HAMP domain-containing sensor histidine kinase [Oharaeibacter diazotrophicus]|uniref:Two-component system sensor histidine kinase UhpB n=2 Tax=Oharaeibacter diazotrophicus TaxID=1920512 RepID=A0A4R6RA09_9HYPH|nr:histidine kinase [Oharaeibacter diazotrophicus]TDP82715.1 two-component system sensor histidine kinase UhpB [Oharaeibacter diazotrophicus]BBE72523.1 sensor histidine kinase LiaS [Pleomorphomonas sp. SM30]